MRETVVIDPALSTSALMLSLAELPYPAFLDSAGSARYDILAADPAAFLLLTPDSTLCSDSDIAIDRSDIYRAISKLQDKYLATSETVDLTEPFTGGIIGFLGYPTLKDNAKASMDVQDAYAGVYHWAVVVDHELGLTTLLIHEQCSPLRKQAIREQLAQLASAQPNNAQPPAFSTTGEFANRRSPADYQQAFTRVQDYIQAGDCYQINLSQEFQLACDGAPLSAYLKLREHSKAPFSAYINWATGALLSASPERFIQASGDKVLTQPIKGTRPRSGDAVLDQELAAELQASEKDRAENLMIVDLLRNDLGQVCVTGSVKVDRLFELHSFSNVHHLVSSISGRLAAKHDALALLKSCFPGGSITGAPKIRAMEIIQELESHERRVFSGSVFYLSANGNMDSNIIIRSLLWQPGELRCWSGGAIVADSDCASEQQECLHKISSIIKALQNGP